MSLAKQNKENVHTNHFKGKWNHRIRNTYIYNTRNYNTCKQSLKCLLNFCKREIFTLFRTSMTTTVQNICCKYLGVYIDLKLTFRDHINHVVKQHNEDSRLIYRTRDYFSIKCLMSFYNEYAWSVTCHGLIL